LFHSSPYGYKNEEYRRIDRCNFYATVVSLFCFFYFHFLFFSFEWEWGKKNYWCKIGWIFVGTFFILSESNILRPLKVLFASICKLLRHRSAKGPWLGHPTPCCATGYRTICWRIWQFENKGSVADCLGNWPDIRNPLLSIWVRFPPEAYLSIITKSRYDKDLDNNHDI